jgi:hypothetical protein
MIIFAYPTAKAMGHPPRKGQAVAARIAPRINRDATFGNWQSTIGNGATRRMIIFAYPTAKAMGHPSDDHLRLPHR